MASEKRQGQEAMFHIQYPAQKDFLSWVELGCLARALGFPKDSVRQHVTDEIHTEENGISLQQLQRMVDHKLLHQALHRSFNMHTADWNLCVIKKAITLLQHCVLSFEELHNIRIAYATYEAADMKGLKLEKRTLLRTLKMCHRTISPLKLMHRVKHMRSKLEEAGRIQLYEFFDLIMWCDYMESLSQTEHVKAEGKENNLYHLVDFETLLSHQDERRSRALDERYLAEEWDFGRERLGSKHMFKGEVVYTEARIQQTNNQKKKYRHLKTEIGQSQRRVYKAHAGSIRARPISAPNLSMYTTPRDTIRHGAASACDVYKSVQRRLHSAPSRASRVNVADRPYIQDYVRVQTPRVVTPNELDEVQLKIATLQFDIFTLDSRCQIKLEEEKDFYIPGYKNRPVQENTGLPREPPKEKEQHWTPEIIQNLAYPHHHLSPHHAETCDARFRGWRKTQRRGRHKILTEPTFISSPQAHLFAKQRSTTLAPVAYMHPDYVVRYTPKSEASKNHEQNGTRPATAPSSSPRAKAVKRIGTQSAGNVRTPAEPACVESRGHWGKASTKREVGEVSDKEMARTREGEARQNAPSEAKFQPDQHEQVAVVKPQPASSGIQQSSGRLQLGLEDNDSAVLASRLALSKPLARGKSNTSSQETFEGEHMLMPSANTPFSRHNRAKTVEVGQIGTITLLESIQERQDLEDHVSDVDKTSPREVIPATKHPQRAARTELASHNARSKARTDDASYRGAITKEALYGPDQHLKEANGRNCSVVISKKPPPCQPRQDTVLDEKGKVNDRVSTKTGQQLLENQTKSRGKTVVIADSSGMDRYSPPSKLQPIHVRNDPRGGHVARETSNKTPDSLSDDDGHTPLTSVTVTIKDKTHHVDNTSLSEAAQDLGNAEEFSDGRFYSPPFAGSPPYSTSTPRRANSPVKLSNRKKIRKENDNLMNHYQQNGGHVFDDHTAQSAVNKLSLLAELTDSANIATQNHAGEPKPQIGSENDDEDVNNEDPKAEAENTNTEEQNGNKKNIQFAPDTLDTKPRSVRPSLQSQSSTERLLRQKEFDLDGDTPRKFSFNKVTTRRLLRRVKEDISQELMTRIRTGDTGLKVV